MTQIPESWWPASRPLVIAHRGDSHAAPQNTLAAFRQAVAIGADGIELDVRLSADGAMVVIHDPQVDSVTDGQGYVHELTLAQLKELDAGSSFSPAFAGERIPTLAEVLEEVGNQLLVNIELKALPERGNRLERLVTDLVVRMGLQNRVWISSFKPYALFQVRKLAPGIPCGMLYTRSSTLLLKPFTPHEALHPHHLRLTAARIHQMHRKGKRVATWTVDHPARARQLADWGVDALITNEPAAILVALKTPGGD